jgi:hypothetical protein
MTPEEMFNSLLGRTIEGVEIDDGDIYLELDDERIFGLYVDEDGDLNASLMGRKTN